MLCECGRSGRRKRLGRRGRGLLIGCVWCSCTHCDAWDVVCMCYDLLEISVGGCLEYLVSGCGAERSRVLIACVVVVEGSAVVVVVVGVVVVVVVVGGGGGDCFARC